MAANFVSIMDTIGHFFRVGVPKVMAVEAKLLPAEEMTAQTIAVFDPPLGASIMAILLPIAKVEQVAAAVGAENGTGLQKLQAALPDVEQVIVGLPIFKGRKVGDQSKFNGALISITGGFADLLNAFESDVPAPVPEAAPQPMGQPR